MTSASHKTGTDRCAELVEKFYSGFDAAVNIQGDEPFIHPEQIDELANCFENQEVNLATLIKKIDSSEDIFNHNRIKVVVDKNMNALFFSRSPIPFHRDKNIPAVYYEHIGVYAFRKQALLNFTAWAITPLEAAEKIECLRYLENGVPLKMVATKYMGIEIDTPEDLIRAASLLK